MRQLFDRVADRRGPPAQHRAADVRDVSVPRAKEDDDRRSPAATRSTTTSTPASPSCSAASPRTCCPAPTAAAREAPERAARHHRARAPLPRRRDHGRRPAGHRGLPGGQPPHREDLQGRRPLRRRHRGRGRPRHGDGQALPDRARALREGRGREPLARRQGQQARPDDPHEPARRPCRASWSCRSSPASTRRPGVGRLFKYDVTGGRYEETRLLRPGLGLQGRARLAQEALAARHAPRGGAAGRHRGADRRGRRGRRHRRPRPRARHLPDREDHHAARASARSPTTRSAAYCEAILADRTQTGNGS